MDIFTLVSISDAIDELSEVINDIIYTSLKNGTVKINED